MKNQDKAKASRNRKRTNWSKLFARSPRVSAHLTQEHEWETDVPNIRLSRAFVIVLAIHVVAVVGIIAFEVKSRDAIPVVAGLESEEAADPAATGEQPPAAPASADPLKHIVAEGETVDAILTRYGVTRADLADNNGKVLGADRDPYIGQVLKIRNARRGMDGAGDTPVMANDRPRTSAFAPMTALVGPDAPPRDFTPQNDPSLERLDVESLMAAVEEFLPLVPDPDETQPEPEPEPEPEIMLIDETEPVVAAARAPASGGAGASTHTVRKGETAFGIGRQYGVPPARLLEANGISDPASIPIGKVLRIPR